MKEGRLISVEQMVGADVQGRYRGHKLVGELSGRFMVTTPFLPTLDLVAELILVQKASKPALTELMPCHLRVMLSEYPLELKYEGSEGALEVFVHHLLKESR